jgi:hypothetical protein
MLARSVKAALAELAGAPGIEAVRACLDHVTVVLIQTPKDAATPIRTLGCADEKDDVAEDLLQILSAALDGARMAQENGQARGGDLIATLENVVAQFG